jgi:type II secretion system protein C
MQNFKSLFVFLFGISFAALVWGISLFFLTKEPIFYIPIKKDYSFFAINLTDIFFNIRENKKQIKKIKQIQTLKGVKLKALYFNGKSGFVILEEKRKTIFVDFGKMYKGYKLIYIGKNYVIFEKNNKEYKLELEKGKIKNTFSIKSGNDNSDNLKQIVMISRYKFNRYINNINKIWKSISILKTIRGYTITYIKPGSIFEKIGLKKGDILLEINGRKLRNDKDAWDLYKHAKEFRIFEIKILRNNKEKVIEYEVD